jgi:hypothetical protein
MGGIDSKAPVCTKAKEMVIHDRIIHAASRRWIWQGQNISSLAATIFRKKSNIFFGWKDST